MDSEIGNLSRKVNAIYGLLFKMGICGTSSSGTVADRRHETEIEVAIRKAIVELESQH